MTPENDDRLLSVKEAAEFLGVHYKTILNHCRLGRIRYGRVGNLIKFTRKDLVAYLYRNHVRPQKDSIASRVN
jgi:excisionase family DNA binding protein